MSEHETGPRRDGGYRHVLEIALPLIIAQAGGTIMFFVDRVFLARYSSNAMAGASFAGLAGWTAMSLFAGTVGYTATFVAQYWGALRRERISVAVWHGVYMALVAGVLLLGLSFFAGPLMGLAGHSSAALAEERIYFRIFVAGGVFMMLSNALSGFYSGLGRTYYNMLLNVPGQALNVFLNYCLIFGRFGFPRWGTKGAATATVISSAVTFLVYMAFLRFGRLGRSFSMLSRPTFEWDMLKRLLRYGVPNGAQWTVDMVGWTAFVMFLYRLGQVEQQAGSVAFSINHLAFLPMLGFGWATSILVGQFVGGGTPVLAEKATRKAFTMTVSYMAVVGAVFVFAPRPLVTLFRPEEASQIWPQAYRLTVVFLRFVALYSLFDAANIVYSSALRGAGDTRFVLFMIAALSLFCLVTPVYLAVEVFHLGFYTAVTIATIYIAVLAFAFYTRYRGGKWKSMRVIESETAVAPTA